MPKTPRFASWEPLTAGIPPVRDRPEALRALKESRRQWSAFRDGILQGTEHLGRPGVHPAGYTYVRAFQSDSDRVVFTVIAVEQGRVVVRALIDAHPDLLDRRYWNAPEARSLWVERGERVGKTRGGAKALTIDELYDACETRVLDRHPELAARLYFHPNGLLMQCGFAEGECGDCPTVSIQSVSRYSVAQEPEWLAPSRWLCGTDWGLFPPGAADPLSNPDSECRPARIPEPPRRKRPEPEPLIETNQEGDPEGETAAEDDAPDRAAETREGGLEDICEIDPAACPVLDCRDTGDCGSAAWVQWRARPCMAFPSRAPSFLEVGKRLPLDDWAFPFVSSNDGIECHGHGYLRHVKPPTHEAEALERWMRASP